MYLENLPFTLFNVGLSYKKADQITRGKFAISPSNQTLLLAEAKSMGISAIMVLSTCNRTEITAFTDQHKKITELIIKYSNGTLQEFNEVCTVYKNHEVINHFFRLGTGLESQLLGDYEIVGQLKIAFKLAKESNTTNHYLERLMSAVLQANKSSKNNTNLCKGTTSVSYAAVQFVNNYFENTNGKKILIYGLGSIGKNTCKNILHYTLNNQVCIINRTYQKSLEFQQKYPTVKVAKENELVSELMKNDVIIVCTGGSSPTITKNHFSNTANKLVLDLCIPNNVSASVNELKNIKLVGLDELSKTTTKTFEIRAQEINKVEEIIEKHKKTFYEWLEHRTFIPVLNELKNSLEALKKDELNYQSKKIENFNHYQAEMITTRIIQKLTSKFMKHLKAEDTLAKESINTIRKIFNQDQLFEK